MARSDLLVELVRANASQDRSHFRKVLEALIAEERAKQHHVLADRLAQLLHGLAATGTQQVAGPPDTAQRLIHEITPRRTLDDLVLTREARELCNSLVEEQSRSDLLRGHGLEPRHRVLLIGPPGNGKTTLAEALASSLVVPLVTVRYEAVVGSFLGETAQRLSRVFEYVSTRNCVLLLDEVETLGKERGDEHETGEIKRVVSSLLLQIDRLPSYVVVVAASNHPELLDRAIWRRFQLLLELPKPSQKMIEDWLGRYSARVGGVFNGNRQLIAKRLVGASFADVEEFALGVSRERILRGPKSDARQAVVHALQAWALRGRARTSKRAR